MPKPSSQDTTPAGLRPYQFHGVDLSLSSKDPNNAIGACPFCGSEGKFSVNVKTTVWRCFACNEGPDKGKAIKGGNSLEFLRFLWKYSHDQTNDYSELLESRGLLSAKVLIRWEVVKSITSGHWLVPGYNIKGDLIQLYKYTRIKKGDSWKSVLLPTPEMGTEGHRHGIFGMKGWNKNAKIVYIHEGPWDGMAAEEVLTATKIVDGEWVPTKNPKESVGAQCNIIGIPGILNMDDKWVSLFQGKNVFIPGDNDHPKVNKVTKAEIPPAGWNGSLRSANMLAGVADSVHVLKWGEQGYDLTLDDGFDVRDAVNGYDNINDRVKALKGIYSLFIPAPTGSGERKPEVKSGTKKLQPLPCSTYKEVINAWRKALKWRKELDYALSAMLSVCLSTEQVGDQLFLMLIADAGTAKTRLCDALLVSDNCYPLEHLSGFHSGWKGDGEGGYSLLERVDRKTMITPEGDVLMSSANFTSIMSQQRRIFDGTSGASYKTMKEDQRFTGLRTPWIIAGTPALMDTDQARLGDRFLKVIIKQPSDHDERQEIINRVAYAALRSVRMRSDKTAEGQLEPMMRQAYQLTGGYVDWLRANAHLLEEVEFSDDNLTLCGVYGSFTAGWRARPSRNKNQVEEHDSKESPTRLTSQFVRMAACETVVLNKTVVDDEVMERVRVNALQTAMGITMKIGSILAKSGRRGETPDSVIFLMGKESQKIRGLLRFLNQIDVVEKFDPINPETGKPMARRYRLTEHMASMWDIVVSEEDVL